MSSLAAVALLGREFEVAAYGIGAMRRAAPIIDRINALTVEVAKAQAEGGQPAVEQMNDLLGLLAAFVQIGLVKVDPALTVEKLEDELGLANLGELQAAFRAICVASGLGSGEAKAPSA